MTQTNQIYRFTKQIDAKWVFNLTEQFCFSLTFDWFLKLMNLNIMFHFVKKKYIKQWNGKQQYALSGKESFNNYSLQNTLIVLRF